LEEKRNENENVKQKNISKYMAYQVIYRIRYPNVTITIRPGRVVNANESDEFRRFSDWFRVVPQESAGWFSDILSMDDTNTLVEKIRNKSNERHFNVTIIREDHGGKTKRKNKRKRTKRKTRSL